MKFFLFNIVSRIILIIVKINESVDISDNLGNWDLYPMSLLNIS